MKNTNRGKNVKLQEDILLDFPKHICVIDSFTQRNDKKYFVLFKKNKLNT